MPRDQGDLSRFEFQRVLQQIVTPITMARFQAHLLEPSVGPDGQAALERLRHQLSVLEDLVSELRGVAVGRRDLRLRFERIDLAEVAATIRQALAPVIAERELDFEAAPMPATPVQADAGRLVVVLRDLALGTARVAPRSSRLALEMTHDVGVVRLRLRFEPPRSFEPGWDPDAALPELDHARRVLRAHDGDIVCRSDKRGSTCEAWLPLAGPAA